MTDFELFTISDALHVTASEAGVRISSDDANIQIGRKETWPKSVLDQPGAWKLAVQIEQLAELGIATIDPSGFLLPYGRMEEAAEAGMSVVSGRVRDCPYLLKIDRHSDLGRPDFRYRYQLLEDGRPAVYDRRGYFIRRVASQEVFGLNSQTFALLEAMDSFNKLPSEERTQQQSWLTFAKVKGCAQEVAVVLDATLSNVDVVIPSTIGLDIQDENDSVTFLPNCPEIGSEEFHRVFDRNSEVEGLYSVDRPGLGKVRIVLSNVQKEVLRRMKRVRRVSGAQRDSLCANPAQVFDGVLDAVELPYSDRVIGIGDFQFSPVPRPRTAESEMAGLFRDIPDASASGPSSKSAGSKEAPESANGESLASSAQGSEDRETEAAPGSTGTPPRVEPSPESVVTGKKFLLIDTHEETIRTELLEAAQQSGPQDAPILFQRPKALRAGINLHPHQEAGIQWMQTCRSVSNRTGVLLADDMGLGKTLQILTFLAWAIETKALPDVSPEQGPYRPVLVVVPLILLENNTWEREMQGFFEKDGAIFLPILKLHGKSIDRVRTPDVGRETEIGRPVLNLDEIQRHRIVLTNYETVRNYQHSFAYMRNGKSLWSAIITDEAQEYKVPNSKISHAVKALKADFSIGSSGTPVENRLLDLWNIMDTLQPGLLKTSREFTRSYEGKQDDACRDVSLRALKEELLIQRPHAFLLRRDKSQVASLPKKTTEKIQCAMSSSEIDRHMELLLELQRLEDPSRFLTVLQRFARLYQHPALLDGDADDLPADELISQSSKLRRVIEQLHQIRVAREKALVFARHVAVQSLLAKVFQFEFRIPVKIINGQTQKSTGAAGGSNRRAILDEFKQKPGFNIVILSPFVAGIGLTITEANHVIHYGRWWNPAVEAQATDRAYRIGQEKDVVVYLPILTDPTGRIASTFDERLDALMDRKYSLAHDFLKPLPAEDELAGDLRRDMVREAGEAR